MVWKRTPQWSSTQVTQIGREGDLSLDTSFRFLLEGSVLYRARNPTSFFSDFPSTPVIGWGVALPVRTRLDRQKLVWK